METLRNLRIKARLSLSELGRLANVDTKTVKRAEDGQPVQELKAISIVEALGESLGMRLSLGDIDGLKIYE